ncbi:retrovirus-related Pol polyprotein from transposon 17.6 [Trichonephila clavipes]|nr:retrovirus-related Pol polyprotein from transposon 17.6 [Trichonephila clavipes]
MSKGPIFHLYKYGRKTELHTDACKQGYGAILLQEAEDGKLHPVYYMSKKTNTAEENRRIYQIFWLYPVKTVSAESAPRKTKTAKPLVIPSELSLIEVQCSLPNYSTTNDEENIQHLQIATGVPRRDGKVERIHRTLIPVLTKTIIRRLNEMVQYVDRLQRILNSTISRSTKWTHFELLVGTKNA